VLDRPQQRVGQVDEEVTDKRAKADDEKVESRKARVAAQRKQKTNRAPRRLKVVAVGEGANRKGKVVVKR